MSQRRLVGRGSSRINRAIRNAYINAKAKIPKDTGTLQSSLELRQTGKGYTMYFIGTNVNPKSKKQVQQYIDYVEKYHENWWDNTVHTFFSELSKTTRNPVVKK